MPIPLTLVWCGVLELPNKDLNLRVSKEISWANRSNVDQGVFGYKYYFIEKVTSATQVLSPPLAFRLQ